MKMLVVGAGVFGSAAAIELRRRGHDVRLLDQGPLPGPFADASSTDSSRAIRMDYGDDAFYVELAAQAMESWRGPWREWRGRTLYHEAGFLFASAAPFETVRGFEAACYETLTRCERVPVRLTAAAVAARFPLWRHAPWVDGYFSAQAGYADAAAVVAMLHEQARAAGVRLEGGRRVVALAAGGVRDGDGQCLAADRVLIAGGAWTTQLLPELQGRVRATAQTVLYLRPGHPERFHHDRAPTWAWDIANQGWYGFPATPAGLVKVAHHGAGREQPADDRQADPTLLDRARRMLRIVLPDLAEAPLHEQKVCFYCDSVDGDFWIGPVPGRAGVVVATGGSGHGFKFAPVLGDLIANAVLGVRDARLSRFAWREPDRAAREAARAKGGA
ncbi:MAG: FAD-dependent oxidoreductase [Planctomycetota bacterium]